MILSEWKLSECEIEKPWEVREVDHGKMFEVAATLLKLDFPLDFGASEHPSSKVNKSFHPNRSARHIFWSQTVPKAFLTVICHLL